MKIEKAIEILDPAYHGSYTGTEVIAACRMGQDALRQMIPCAADDEKANGSQKIVKSAYTVRCGCCHEVYEIIWPRCFYPFCPICGQRQDLVEGDDR